MSTPPVEKLRRKGCCGDGRRESHGGGDDGARGGCGDGGCHAGAGAGRRRVWVAAGPPVGQAAAPCWNGSGPTPGAAESCFAGTARPPSRASPKFGIPAPRATGRQPSSGGLHETSGGENP